MARVAQRPTEAEVGHVAVSTPVDLEALGAQLGHGVVERARLDVGQDHPHALAGEPLAHGPADAAGPAGDHRHPAREVLDQLSLARPATGRRSAGGRRADPLAGHRCRGSRRVWMLLRSASVISTQLADREVGHRVEARLAQDDLAVDRLELPGLLGRGGSRRGRVAVEALAVGGRAGT